MVPYITGQMEGIGGGGCVPFNIEELLLKLSPPPLNVKLIPTHCPA